MLMAFMELTVDWIAIRKGLADQRLAADVSPEDLAKKITAAGDKINKTTIYRIENVADREGHKPRLETIGLWLKYTTGLTLSSFFAQIESQTEGDLSPGAGTGSTATTPEESGSRARQDHAVSVDADKLLAAGNALVDAGGLFIAAAKGVEVGKGPRARHDARGGTARQRRRVGGNR